jgi:hypothetical protein
MEVFMSIGCVVSSEELEDFRATRMRVGKPSHIVYLLVNDHPQVTCSDMLLDLGPRDHSLCGHPQLRLLAEVHRDRDLKKRGEYKNKKIIKMRKLQKQTNKFCPQKKKKRDV